MASTAPISHPSQYMIATTRQITPVAEHKPKAASTEPTHAGKHASSPLPKIVMSTGSSSRGCAVNTDTVATQIASDSSRLQRALSTPATPNMSLRHSCSSQTKWFVFLACKYHSPMISMKICFQCSHVWKPLCRAEDCGRPASCSWMKVSHWRKSE